ncbi:hypothetical protein [Urbifossiella limnaea]|uniref:Uncharacterized protein n=1 Tax=Urbifossiella limnaea TaxID=2528023 RepID=A0A517XUV6_9BACT|nr:hypothetical protein [Urbifossiella limnaea]QDU21274.1 hypothetical protein ETAA1_32400 [Urbifossiella limnaea]
MNVRGRVARLRAGLVGRDGDDLAHIVVRVPAGGDPDGRPPGVYRSGGVIDVVYDGDEPDPVPRERVLRKAPPAALEIVLGPDVVPPPAAVETADLGRRS